MFQKACDNGPLGLFSLSLGTQDKPLSQGLSGLGTAGEPPILWVAVSSLDSGFLVGGSQRP